MIICFVITIFLFFVQGPIWAQFFFLFIGGFATITQLAGFSFRDIFRSNEEQQIVNEIFGPLFEVFNDIYERLEDYDELYVEEADLSDLLSNIMKNFFLQKFNGR